MHDGGSRLVVLGLGDPHLLEGAERGQDGPADPHRVFAFRRSDHLGRLMDGKMRWWDERVGWVERG